MKKIMLLRHADTEWESPSGHDRMRALTKKGQDQAQDLGIFLKQRNYIPNHIITSNALRTVQTRENLLKTLGMNISHEADNFLYNCKKKTLIDKISDISEAHSTVLIINHNPTIHQLALDMAEDHIHLANNPDLEKILQSYPPCTLTIFDCDIEHWFEFDTDRCRLGLSHFTL